MKRVYDIEGEELTFGEIRKRVSPTIGLHTLRKRLEVYQRRTWASLNEPPNHRPRPDQRVRVFPTPARLVLPAWPTIE